MKKTLFIITLCLFILSGVQAQQPQNRTASTVIADALVQLPADNQEEYNLIITDLIGTGEYGLLRLVKMLQAPGNQSNEAVEFALSGWTHMASTNEAWRQTTAKAYLKALGTVSVPEIRAFIIRQLERIGGEESINTLATYLVDESLADPAAQALVSIKNEKADAALLSALKGARSQNIQLTLVNALGQAQYAAAEEYLLTLLQQELSSELRGAVLMALGETGSKEALKTLRKTAEAEAYVYNKEGAVKAYTNLVSRVAAQGDTKTAKKEATRIFKKATGQNQQELRINALEILMGLPGADKDELLADALDDDHVDYATSALRLYTAHGGDKNNKLIVESILDAVPGVQAAIIYWLGNQKVSSSIPVIAETLKSVHPDEVQRAAIHASEKLGGDKLLEALAALLQSNNQETVRLVSRALSTFKGNIHNTLAAAYPKAGSAGKAAILELLASRRASAQYQLVLDATDSEDKLIRDAALIALPNVAGEENLEELFTLLKNTGAENIDAIRKSISMVLSDHKPADRYEVIRTRMEKPGAQKKLYYSLLAGTGASNALELLIAEYDQSSGEDKLAAFEALTQWQGFEVIHPLLSIARKSDQPSEVNKSVNAIIDVIARSGQTGEVQTIFLREAMALAETDQHKAKILALAGNTGTFQSLIFLEGYLDNPKLQETAAQSVMKIALNHSEYAGAIVTRQLNKVSKVLDNPDAQYQRQAIQKYLDENPTQGGYVSMFNGENLDGWQGLVGNPVSRASMSEKELAKKQIVANREMAKNWSVKDGNIVFDGKGANLCSVKDYGDFEMKVDWRITKDGDSGIYLRGTPQVQIWDTSRVDVGAQVGSGGLYNNQKHPSKPIKVADNRIGEWNTFHIKMVGEKVNVWLNGELVVDNVTMENYWDRSRPIFPTETIELQAHGSDLGFRDIYVKEVERREHAITEEEKKAGFEVLFDGTNLDKWTGNTADYLIENGDLVVRPSKSFGGNLYTQKEYGDFVFRFEFQLTPGANNGLGIRTPMEVDAAYAGMELQILDNTAPVYADLEAYQYHGSVYGIIPAKRGYLNPVGEWNYQEVVAKGDHIKITLNGTVIIDGNLREATKNGTADGKEHPGLFSEKGHIGFLGHGSVVKFRNIRVKELD